MSDLRAITDELMQMYKADQEMRAIWSEHLNKGDKDANKYHDKELDQKHNLRLSEIIEEIGWPTISKVGKDASHAAWLIVQHSPEDDFQSRCLSLMNAVKDDVDLCNLAYLEDRVRMRSGRPQLYGTQMCKKSNADKYELYEVEDFEGLAKRREALGLEPIEEYVKRFKNTV